MSSRSISALDPRIQSLVRKLLDEFNALDNDGWVAFITDGFRTGEEQEALYARGRTTPGPIVTYTRESNHELGLAVDIAFQRNGVLSYSPGLYNKLVPIAKGLGFTWGGYWNQHDTPHFEMIDFPITNNDENMITDDTTIDLPEPFNKMSIRDIKSNLNSLVSIKKTNEELLADVAKARSEAKGWKDKYDNFITILAKKLDTTQDEVRIETEVDDLIRKEDKLTEIKDNRPLVSASPIHKLLEQIATYLKLLVKRKNGK